MSDIVKRLRKHGGHGFLIGAEAADYIDRLRAAAIKARTALSELVATRDPKVYSDALRALDEAFG